MFILHSNDLLNGFWDNLGSLGSLAILSSLGNVGSLARLVSLGSQSGQSAQSAQDGQIVSNSIQQIIRKLNKQCESWGIMTKNLLTFLKLLIF